MDITIAVPLYNEEESLPELSEWIDKVMVANNFSYEVIFVDDGSTDKSWKVIEDLSAKNQNLKGIKFRRNYGKSAALNTAFEHAEGEVVITMDADLQDSPDEIPDLYKMIKGGMDLVSGWKKKRFDPITKTIPTKFFNYFTRKMSGIKLHDFNCGLKAYRIEVVKSIEVYGEMHRYIPVLSKWAGFTKITEKVVQHQERKHGVTKFGWNRFINGFLDLISITFVTRFQKKPMHFFGTLGSLSFFAGFWMTVWIIFDKMNGIYNYIPALKTPSRDIVDQPLFFIALIMVVLGSQLFLAGFLGDMISRNAPDRNNYLIDKKTFSPNKE